MENYKEVIKSLAGAESLCKSDTDKLSNAIDLMVSIEGEEATSEYLKNFRYRWHQMFEEMFDPYYWQ